MLHTNTITSFRNNGIYLYNNTEINKYTLFVNTTNNFDKSQINTINKSLQPTLDLIQKQYLCFR